MEITEEQPNPVTFERRPEFVKQILRKLGLIPRAINPFWWFYWLIHNYRREKYNANLNIVLSMSDVINSMPTEVKKLLTVVDKEKGTIPPQQSFIEFLKPYNMLHIDAALFRYKFIELYTRKNKEWIRELKRSEMSLEKVNEFWNKFITLVDPDFVDKKEEYLKPVMKVSIVLVTLSQKWRRLKRVLFSNAKGLD